MTKDIKSSRTLIVYKYVDYDKLIIKFFKDKLYIVTVTQPKI